MVNLESLKKIRQLTQAPVDAIKKALEEADDKIESTLELLKRRGGSIAAKKSERSTKEGAVISYVHSNGKIGVVVKLLCETDFVARNEIFQKLGREIAMHIAAMNPSNIEELLFQPYMRDQDVSIENLVKDHIAKLGENIKVEEFCRLEI